MCVECFYVLSNVISTEDGEMNITDENLVAIYLSEIMLTNVRVISFTFYLLDSLFLICEEVEKFYA